MIMPAPNHPTQINRVYNVKCELVGHQTTHMTHLQSIYAPIHHNALQQCHEMAACDEPHRHLNAATPNKLSLRQAQHG
jgi:hypothetical protein